VEQRVLDEMVIIVAGNHGNALGEHGIHSDHVCVNECIDRIAPIVRWPGITAPGSASRWTGRSVSMSKMTMRMAWKITDGHAGVNRDAPLHKGRRLR
jgi:hypothetical protein